MTIRWKIAAAGLTFAVTCAGLLGTGVLGPQPANARQENDVIKPAAAINEDRVTSLADDTRRPTPTLYGTAACSNKGCHGGQKPEIWVKGRDLITSSEEAKIYSMHDKHAYAYKALTGDRGKRMGKLLGYKHPVTQEKLCLTCHSTYVEDKALIEVGKVLHFSLDEGVSCVTCHGAYEEWVGAHATMVTARHFRKLTAKQKEEQYGLANLRDPARQADLCVSCHVGNLEQHKFVTHEMYAAGHPPLPSFEIGAFTEQEPKHWTYLRDKSQALQKELGLPRQGELEQTQLIMVGALTSMRETMKLLATQAATARTTTDPDKKSLDLSNFDCWSCHHGIRSPSWRQARGYDGTPGRVPWRAWPAELIPTVLDHLVEVDSDFKANAGAERKAFADGLAALKKAFDAKVYGNPAQIEKASRDLLSWSEKTLARVKATYPTNQSARAVLAKMPEQYGNRGNDYDSARETAWAFRTIYDEVFPKGSGDLGVRQRLSKLDELLKLQLPEGRGDIEKDMDKSLDAIKDYDHRKYRPLMQALKSASGKR